MGIYLNQRNYFTAGDSGFFTNVNRVFPGTAASAGGSGPQILAYNIWNHIWGNTSQVDVGIDLRTFRTSSLLLSHTNYTQTLRLQVARHPSGATLTSASPTSNASPNSSNPTP
jgi:hypothetical protein